jgi:large subunit ribosomal protein L3
MSKIRGKGLLGIKIGMTSIFTEEGNQIPVTVVRAGPNVVLGKQPIGNEDGEVNLLVGFGEKRESLFNKPELGFFRKAGVAPTRWQKAFRVKEDVAAGLEVGATLGVDIFQMGQYVDVTGTSKGRGFAGVVKRHGMAGQGPRGSHGVHEVHRNVGSIGQRKTPGRVFPGKRMAGHMGNDTVTVRNLQIVGMDEEKQILLLHGATPGHRNGLLILRPAVRAPRIGKQQERRRPLNPMKASKGWG